MGRPHAGRVLGDANMIDAARRTKANRRRRHQRDEGAERIADDVQPRTAHVQVTTRSTDVHVRRFVRVAVTVQIAVQEDDGYVVAHGETQNPGGSGTQIPFAVNSGKPF